jgi:hypothetical protein
VLLLPPLALASGLVARIATGRPQTNPRAPPRFGAVAEADDAPAGRPYPQPSASPREAWLTVADRAGFRLAMPRELLRIGREDDNDLVLDQPTVHRYHAIIHRTADALFLIKDLAGPGGNGVFVNGERVTESHLLDGDLIMLGGTQVAFHTRRTGASDEKYGIPDKRFVTVAERTI